MERVKINPLGKIYYFNFNEYSCYKCKTGICPLDKLSIDEIKNLQKVDNFCIKENSEEYCTDLARKIITFDAVIDYDFTYSIWLYYNNECGHYSLGNGQHRTCIIARLYQKHADIKYIPHFISQGGKCLYCLNNEYYKNLENSLNFFDKVFKTKKYKKVNEYKKQRKNKCSLYSF